MDKDLYDLASKMNAKVTDATIRARGTAVMNAFSTVVLHERHGSERRLARHHDLRPGGKNQKIDYAYYRTLDLALQTQLGRVPDRLRAAGRDSLVSIG